MAERTEEPGANHPEIVSEQEGRVVEKEGAKPERESSAEGGEGEKGGEEEPEVKPQLFGDPEEPNDDVPIVLVTGASGYVATNLIKQLLKQARFRVRGTVRSLENEIKVQPLRELVAEPKYPLRLVEANLLHPKSWIEAVRRCRYVFHVASPNPLKIPNNGRVLTKPAMEGTINILKACADSGTVKRVVLTSSYFAVSSGMFGNPGVPPNYVYTEKDWSVVEVCSPYELSKLRAEQAAWTFVKQLKEGRQFELVSLCPGLILGPALTAITAHKSASLSPCKGLLNHKLLGVPNVSSSVIDVRDVAAAHIAAVERPEAAGNRYLLVNNETVEFAHIAQILAAEFRPQGYTVTTRILPKILVWFVKFFDDVASRTYPFIGKQLTWNNEKMKHELGIEPHDLEQTVIDMGYSLIELGAVPRTQGYLGRPSTRPFHK